MGGIKMMAGVSAQGRNFVGTPPYGVTFDGKPLAHRGGHSREFAWGYGGSGPADLAFSVIAAMIPQANDDHIRKVAYDFKWEVIAKLDGDKVWVLTEREVRNWVELWEAEHADTA